MFYIHSFSKFKFVMVFSKATFRITHNWKNAMIKKNIYPKNKQAKILCDLIYTNIV